jgi:hypothetical protein
MVSEQYSLSINNATTFTFGGERFTNTPGTSSYRGSWTWDDGTNSQMRIEVLTSTSMRGELTGNFTIDGTACSATTLFLITR